MRSGAAVVSARGIDVIDTKAFPERVVGDKRNPLDEAPDEAPDVLRNKRIS